MFHKRKIWNGHVHREPVNAFSDELWDGKMEGREGEEK